MELREITQEDTLIKSYKPAYIDDRAKQAYELLKIYNDNKRLFPVFGKHVFKDAGDGPADLIDSKLRNVPDDKDVGRLFIFERIDQPGNMKLTRLFFVWATPAQVSEFASADPANLRIKANVVFHPMASLEDYPKYWDGGLDPLQIPNFLELGVRYLFKDRHSVAQHFCAVKPTPRGDGSELRSCPFSMLLIVPVSSLDAYMNLSDPQQLQDAIQQIAKLCFEGVARKMVSASTVKLERIALSGYSRSGVVVAALLTQGRSSAFMRDSVKEVWTFDVMLDHKPVTKRAGYKAMWEDIKTWRAGDPDRKARIYSAEQDSVADIYSDLRKDAGAYKRNPVNFRAFNGRTKIGATTYAGLMDGYEIYTADDACSLVALALANFLVYLPGSEKQGYQDRQANPQGFSPDPIQPTLMGHEWFISRLQSHALYNSGF